MNEHDPPENAPSALKIRRFALEALDRLGETYRVLVDKNGIYSCVAIVGNGVLKPVNTDVIINKLALLFMGKLAYSQLRREVFPTWQACSVTQHGIRAHEVAPLLFEDDDSSVWTWQRMPFTRTQTQELGDCPETLLSMLVRTTPEQARSLVLWLGSLLDHRFPRSQYLYLHGDGNDGKSTLIRMLSTVIGGPQGIAFLRSDNFSDAHMDTILEGTRLAVFSDENSTSFMSKGRFKALTGDVELTINPKGEKRRNIALTCKVLIASNNPPSVQGGRADLRRIIPVELQPIPPEQSSHTKGEAFVADGIAIMRYCYAAFRCWQLANPDCMLPTAEDAMSEVMEASFQVEEEDIVRSLFEFSPQNEMSAAALDAFLRQAFHTQNSPRRIYKILRKFGAKRIVRDATRMWLGVCIKATAA